MIVPGNLVHTKEKNDRPAKETLVRQHSNSSELETHKKHKISSSSSSSSSEDNEDMEQSDSGPEGAGSPSGRKEIDPEQ